MNLYSARGAKREGFILMTALLLAGIAAFLVMGIYSQSVTQARIAGRQEALEEALYVAEGGCAMCMSHIMSRASVPASITGSIGDGIYLANVSLDASASILSYTLVSTGIVRGVRRTITMDYVHSRSWAEYALWYDHYAGQIWFQTGDRFKGKVHANDYLYLQGSPVFEKVLTSAKSSWGSGPASAVFSNGYQLGVQYMSMSSVNFTNTASSQDCLRVAADLVLTGDTRIALGGTNLYITNGRRGWTNVNYAVTNRTILSNGTVYVATSGTSTGILTMAGTLKGRLTLVADGAINITNHIRYSSSPATNAACTDALGLITRGDIVVKTNCPANLDVFAHMIATGEATASTNDGMFTVENYSSRPTSSCSNLNVYGGIVEYYRGPVGTTSGYGYLKNYIFDTRFKTNPPPHYPVVGDEYYWGGWRDSP